MLWQSNGSSNLPILTQLIYDFNMVHWMNRTVYFKMTVCVEINANTHGLAPLTVQNIIRLFTRIYRHRHAAPLLLHIILYAHGQCMKKVTTCLRSKDLRINMLNIFLFKINSIF